MHARSVLLISGPARDRPPVRDALLDELRRLKERRGELIAAVDDDTGRVLGTLGLFPDRDEGGRYFHLASLQVEADPAHHEPPHADVDVFLMEQAEKLLQAKRVTRLKLGTSPLLTRSAWLYVTRFGGRYRWREGMKTPEGRLWPWVTCECDFDDPVARPLDLRDDEVNARSLLTWAGGMPGRRADLVFSGPLSVTLPDLDRDGLAVVSSANPGLIDVLYDAFRALHLHGYEFAWFDRLPEGAPSPSSPRWYFVMKRVVSL